MKFLTALLILLPLWLPNFVFARAVVYQDRFGRVIEINPEISAPLTELLAQRAEPSAHRVLTSLANERAALDELQTLALSDPSLLNNQDAESFMRLNGVKPEQLLHLRLTFVDTAARGVIEYLRGNPKALAILLARDMEDVFKRAEFILTYDPGLAIETTEREDIYRRLRLQPGSRDVFKAARTSTEVLNVLGLDASTMQRFSEISLFDFGYEGSIPKTITPLLATVPEASVLKWKYVWKAPVAPSYVSTWPEEFYPKLRESFGTMAPKILNEAGPSSFRVLVLEHHPKWNGQLTGLVKSPVHIMLDVDDTVLKDVSIAKYGQHPGVQILKYVPSPDIAEKYKKRLSEPETADKVVHYAFEPEGSMRSSVVVRPAMIQFFDSIAPLIRSGAVKLHLTSVNDPARTRAVLEQLKFDGRTLAEIGADIVPVQQFLNAERKKDTAVFKKSLGLEPGTRVVATDDRLVQMGSADDIMVNVPEFTREAAASVLNGGADEAVRRLNDDTDIRQATQAVYLARTIEVTPLDRVRSMAFRIFNYSIDSCEKALTRHP